MCKHWLRVSCFSCLVLLFLFHIIVCSSSIFLFVWSSSPATLLSWSSTWSRLHRTTRSVGWRASTGPSVGRRLCGLGRCRSWWRPSSCVRSAWSLPPTDPCRREALELRKPVPLPWHHTSAWCLPTLKNHLALFEVKNSEEHIKNNCSKGPDSIFNRANKLPFDIHEVGPFSHESYFDEILLKSSWKWYR